MGRQLQSPVSYKKPILSLPFTLSAVCPFRKPHPHLGGLHYEDRRIRFSGGTADAAAVLAVLAVLLDRGFRRTLEAAEAALLLVTSVLLLRAIAMRPVPSENSIRTAL